MSGSNDNSEALDRALGLLVEILDQPLVVLPGSHPMDADGATELRLRHFRPELSERIAGLLEEQGR